MYPCCCGGAEDAALGNRPSTLFCRERCNECCVAYEVEGDAVCDGPCPNYHPNGFFKSISPAIPNKPIEVGDKLHNVLEGGTFNPVVLVRSISSSPLSPFVSRTSSFQASLT